MKTPDMEQRLRLLNEKVQTQYENLGHSPTHPYVYFVYDPDDERLFPELLLQYFPEGEHFSFSAFDLLQVTIESLEGKEESYQDILNDPLLADVARSEIVLLWAEVTVSRIVALVSHLPAPTRPVVILYGVAALDPLGTPTQLMQLVAEMEPRDERTGRAVPIVVFIPGYMPPLSNRYHFLDRANPRLPFYQGESL